MITISREDVNKLRDLFGGNSWTSAQLEMILRKFDGNLDLACNRILQHGDQDPRLLMQHLGLPMGTGATAQLSPAPKNPDEAEGIVWCWKETPGQMYHHDANQIVGDPSDCWIRFSLYQSQELEISYQLQEGTCEIAAGHHSNGTDRYRIDFRSMQQTNLRTGYQRRIQRREKGESSMGSPTTTIAAVGREPSPMAVATPIFPTPATPQSSSNVPIASAQVLPRPVAASMPPVPVAQNATTASPVTAHPRIQSRPVQPPPQQPQASPPLASFIAQRAFAGNPAQGQLQFQAGERVFVLPVAETNGWRLGRVHNHQGWFPVPFLPPPSGAQPNNQAGALLAQQPKPHPNQTSTADIMKLYDQSKSPPGKLPNQNLELVQEKIPMPRQVPQKQPQSMPSVGVGIAAGCSNPSVEMTSPSAGAPKKSDDVPLNSQNPPKSFPVTASVIQQQSHVFPAKQSVPFMPSAPSAAPSAQMKSLWDELPDYTLINLGNSSTPQYKAWQWLDRHPDLSDMPLWRQKQLFALVCFFYAMEGPNWLAPISDS